MGKTIKGKEVIAYKGMKFDMSCKGFHYEVGKTYKTDKVELCNCGFHACLNPLDVLDYYSKYRNSRYFKVKLSGKITKCGFGDTKVAATDITILEEITDTFNEVINITKWWKNDNVLDLLYFKDGFAKVQRTNGDCNFIDKNGNYLFTKWFYWLDNFKEGFARVKRVDRKYNFMDAQGKFLSDEWFMYVCDFNKGFAIVQKTNGKWTKIDKYGNLIKN